jgi:hypothetical protein
MALLLLLAQPSKIAEKRPMKIQTRMDNVAPHLLPPERLVERRYDIQILLNRRAESSGGG